jgi:hypothetical protein
MLSGSKTGGHDHHAKWRPSGTGRRSQWSWSGEPGQTGIRMLPVDQQNRLDSVDS